MTYILIIILTNYWGQSAATSAEFNSLVACEYARNEVNNLQIKTPHSGRQVAICVPKG